MELRKFGPILKFAIELERRAAEFYEGAAAVAPSPQLTQSAAAARKRLSRLELMRRELVNEMLLEPIAGFEPPPLPDLEVSCADRKHIREQHEQLGQARSQFYAVASVKIEPVAPAASRAFGRMAGDA